MNILQRGAQWQADLLIDGLTDESETAAVEIVYRRGAASASLSALVSLHQFDQEDTDGVITTVTAREYTIRAAELILSGLHTNPRPGDLIDEVIDDVTETYEVTPVAGAQEFEPADANRVMLVIRTKRVVK